MFITITNCEPGKFIKVHSILNNIAHSLLWHREQEKYPAFNSPKKY